MANMKSNNKGKIIDIISAILIKTDKYEKWEKQIGYIKVIKVELTYFLKINVLVTYELVLLRHCDNWFGHLNDLNIEF